MKDVNWLGYPWVSSWAGGSVNGYLGASFGGGAGLASSRGAGTLPRRPRQFCSEACLKLVAFDVDSMSKV